MSVTDREAKIAAFRDYITRTMVGTERGLYRMWSAGALPGDLYAPPAEGERPPRMGLVMRFLARYFNDAYKTLVLYHKGQHEGLDMVYVTDFTELHGQFGHSYICLLNIVLHLSLGAFMGVDTRELDYSSLEMFTDSYKKQIGEWFNVHGDRVLECLDHECKGMDIAECDPDEPMFTLQASSDAPTPDEGEGEGGEESSAAAEGEGGGDGANGEGTISAGGGDDAPAEGGDEEGAGGEEAP